MPELIYKRDYGEIILYEIKDGKTEYIKTFNDREDLLKYIEDTYEYAKLYCGCSMYDQ